jgi:diguanylate cyclase (GGDEF)-like protein
MTNPLFERIKATGVLPSPQGVALRLLQLVADDRATIAQVVATVEADPAIVSRLLKLVNSPLAGVSRTVVSVTSAVTLLGLRTVRTLALGHSLISSFRSGRCSAFDFERFWSQSLARAVAARGLAGELGGTSPDEAFTVALLSKVGKLALATVFPAAYDELLSRLRDDPSASLGQLECRQFGLDHNELAALMMADWHLPALFCEAVRNQDSVERAGDTPSRALNVARILRVSEAIATLLVKPTPYQDDVATMLGTAQECGVTQTVISTVYESARESWREACAVFSVTANDTVSLPELHCRASRECRQVLVVDDDPDCLRLLRNHLSNAGYEVVEARNGVEALRILHAEGCRIVVTDWNMPEMDGLQLCRAIRGDEGAGFIHIVMMTAADSTEKMAQAFEAGADDFLQKPFKPMELLARLKAGVRAVGADAKVAVQQLALFKSNAELAVLNTKLERSATTDELTGLGNRRAALDRLRELYASLERHQTALACILIDIDHFKRVNDTFGHEAGDVVLRETANALRRAARIDEPVFRLGGEEFLVLCPGASADDAVQGAERFRHAVAASAVKYDNDQISVTISCGVAEWGLDTKTTDELLRMADQALYCAKRAGRNQVCAFGCVDGKPGPVCRPSSALLPPAINGQLSRYKILVVDDDPDCRKLCKLHLSRAGHEVTEAESGEAALGAVQQVNPDVIVIDVMMPGMNGIECTRQLKSNRSTADIPVLISSGRTDASDIVEGFSAGADEYVTKPVHPREFVARVEGLARSLRKTRQLQSAIAELASANAERGEQARAMGILFELANALSLVESEEKILQEIVDATTQLLLSQRVSVMFPTADGAELRIAQSVGIDEDTARRIRVPRGRLVAGRVFETGERIVKNGPNAEEVGGNRYDSPFFASVPLASVALGTSGRVIGVLNVTERYEHKPFDDRDLQYLDLIANLAHSTIEHFRDQQSRLEAQQAIVTGLATLAEYRDADTGRHLERVTNYALMLAEELQKRGPYAGTLDATFLADLRDAMPLHDIGKVGIPDRILLKCGPLSPTERKAIEKHPGFGAKAIQAVIDKAPSAGFMIMARDIALCHHERFDGAGYPSGLAEHRIPLAARIASVADVYDALTTKRPYRNAMSHEQAVNLILEGRETQFDPHVVDAFLRCEKRIADLSIELGQETESVQEPDGPHRKLLTAIP